LTPLAGHVCAAMLVVFVGVTGLIDVSLPRRLVESWINIHALFAMVLCGIVIAQYRRRVGHLPGVEPYDVRDLSRGLSRMVYLSLYGVIAVREGISLTDFEPWEPRSLGGAAGGAFDPNDDFQMFLVSGLVALIFVRVLVFRLWLRMRGARVSAQRNIRSV
jgi:hypothetical protein